MRIVAIRSTGSSRIVYWIAGALLLWLMFPIGILDILIEPKWFAPNPQCDSLGVPILWLQEGLIPWALISVVIPAIPVFLIVRKRVAGADIFDLHLGTAPWNWIVTLLTAAALLPIIFDMGRYLWEVSVLQTITGDCGGSAEPVTITMRRPIIQFTPLWEAGFALWILHLRALLLSPRRVEQFTPLPSAES